MRRTELLRGRRNLRWEAAFGGWQQGRLAQTEAATRATRPSSPSSGTLAQLGIERIPAYSLEARRGNS